MSRVLDAIGRDQTITVGVLAQRLGRDIDDALTRAILVDCLKAAGFVQGWDHTSRKRGGRPVRVWMRLSAIQAARPAS